MGYESDYWRIAARRRPTRRRLIVTAGACAALSAATLAAGCEGQKSTRAQNTTSAGATGVPGAEAPQSGGIYNYYLIGNPPTLDPHRTTSNLSHRMAGAAYNRLFRFKTAHDPQVAESRELENDLGISAESSDAITWTIKLRPDAKFQSIAPVNGHAVEAEDVKASFIRALDPKNPNGSSLDMLDANQIQAPSSDTVVFKLKYPYAAFPAGILALQNGWILPREALAGTYDPGKQLIGSGPFILDSFTPDVAISFKRNPDWFEKGQPYIDGVRVAIIPDSAQQLAQFKAGNLDEIDVSANDVDTVKRDNPKADLLTGAPASVNLLVGQLGDPSSPWVDARVRRAFSIAMDRAAMAAAVLGDKFQMQAVVPLSLGNWALKPVDLDPTLAQMYKYDPTTSRKLLSEAGDSNLELKFVYTPNGYAQPYGSLAEAISNMLNAVGVKTNLVSLDYNSEYMASGKGYRFGNYKKDFVMLGASSGGYTVIDEFIFSSYHSKSAKRFTQLSDATLDGQIEKARTVVNEEDRLKAYLDIQRYLVEKSYYVTSWPWQPAYTMVQPWVRNYTRSTSYAFFTESYAKLWLKKS